MGAASFRGCRPFLLGGVVWVVVCEGVTVSFAYELPALDYGWVLEARGLTVKVEQR